MSLKCREGYDSKSSPEEVPSNSALYKAQSRLPRVPSIGVERALLQVDRAWPPRLILVRWRYGSWGEIDRESYLCHIRGDLIVLRNVDVEDMFPDEFDVVERLGGIGVGGWGLVYMVSLGLPTPRYGWSWQQRYEIPVLRVYCDIGK